MKICFTGPLLGFSGFSTASRNVLHALHNAGANLVARNLVYDIADPGTEFKTPDWLAAHLKKPLVDIDFLIQATTCNVEAVPKPGIFNALYTFFELDRIPGHWIQKANEFDLIIVPCQFNAQMLAQCGITKPVLIMQPPADLSYYDTFLNPVEDPGLPDLEGKTIFYNICQLSSKKGIDLLLRAYYAAFADMPDEVVLILKTYINMGDRQNDLATVKDFIARVKQGIRMPFDKMPPVLPIVSVFSENKIRGLHIKCHAYVNSSRGEGFCIPAFDALGFGNVLISNNYGGMHEYVTNDVALLYGGTISNVMDAPHAEPLLYTGVSRWFEPSTAFMADTMRNYHLLRKGAVKKELSPEHQQLWDTVVKRQENGKELVKRYCINKNGPNILGLLTQAHDSWKKTGKVEVATQEKSQ